jgi:hypothetical protein
MTREEAKDRYSGIPIVFQVIDSIYDDFDARTCESCKYWGYSTKESMYEDCNFGLIDHSYNPDSFGCSQWESKDE